MHRFIGKVIKVLRPLDEKQYKVRALYMEMTHSIYTVRNKKAITVKNNHGYDCENGDIIVAQSSNNKFTIDCIIKKAPIYLHQKSNIKYLHSL
jgi:hypothetical protein